MDILSGNSSALVCFVNLQAHREMCVCCFVETYGWHPCAERLGDKTLRPTTHPLISVFGFAIQYRCHAENARNRANDWLLWYIMLSATSLAVVQTQTIQTFEKVSHIYGLHHNGLTWIWPSTSNFTTMQRPELSSAVPGLLHPQRALQEASFAWNILAYDQELIKLSRNQSTRDVHLTELLCWDPTSRRYAELSVSRMHLQWFVHVS